MSRSAFVLAALFLALASPAAGTSFIRGDSNASGGVDLSDAVRVLDYLFLGAQEPACLDSADSNDDGQIDLSDALYTLFFLFLGGAPLPAPGLACGPDPTDDDGVGCLGFGPCRSCSGVLTPSATEGPYWKAGSPRRSSLLEAGVVGEKLVLSGRVLAPGCLPVGGATIDFWQADGNGDYDNAGYRLRGHQLSGDDGRYLLETVIPGIYPGRTEHIHVKVAPPGRTALTTQLFFPGVPGNGTDGIYRPDLEISIGDSADGKTGTFDFVVNP